MEDKYSIEDIKKLRIGIFALCVIILISFITISHNASIKKDGIGGTYNIYAVFGRTDGLNVGDAVRMSGVSIGRVVNASLDDNFKSKLTFEIDAKYNIPDDSSASIVSFGLIGGKYVEIDVGGSEDYVKPEDTLEYTQDAMVLEELLERIISMGKSKNKSNNASSNDAENLKDDNIIDGGDNE
ncbi:MAG: MCE family protein [Alphaproteobacteria bacterium]|nr:MCE family protein [Alphaproteobacteria bacterium]